MSMKVLVILAQGFEEIEAVTCIDILRRAGIEVVVAGLESETITGSHGITITADKQLDQVLPDFDACVLPGGMPGATHLSESKKVSEIIQKMDRGKKIIAAICAAPAVVLSPLGILKNKNATCYPGLQNRFGSDVHFKQDPVVVDGNIITSRGVGTALAFALAVVEKLCGKQAGEKVGRDTLNKQESTKQ